MICAKLVKAYKILFKCSQTKYDNSIDANKPTMLIKKIFGLVVVEYKHESGVIVTRLSYWGFISFLFWYGLFVFCVINVYIKDHTILRNLYDTRLKRYGDEYERIATLLFVLYAMWKLAFNLYGNTSYVKYLIEVDNAVKRLGLDIDYITAAIIGFFCTMSQLLVYFARTLYICVTFNSLDMAIPYERIFQVVFCDALALILSGHFCFYLFILKERYCMLNSVLNDIKVYKSWEYTMFIRDKPNKEKASQLQDKYICQKIESVAKIYCMLYEATNRVNKMYGVAIVMITFLGMNSIILYLFYFMEATASGLFNDMRRYIYFLIYILWQTGYATGIIYMVVYFSENIVNKVEDAAFLATEIINSNMSPLVTEAALRLSLQFLHQKPLFKPCGFFTLDYGFLFQTARSVVTFLVILLQFVMEK
ncbi:hypothetical protein ACJJTC_019609 [Scirpophaga incertulas]